MKTIGLIGCGGIGRQHARRLARRASLFFCDQLCQNAEQFEREFNGSGVCGSVAEMLARPEIDAVLIASPAQVHAGQVVAALEAGKAVLVEKPLCVSRDELQAIDRAVTTSRLLMVAENYYHRPLLNALRNAIGSGAIGEIQSVEVTRQFTQRSPGWRGELGALLEGGIHFVALISALFDAAPQHVAASFSGHQPGLPERHSHLRLSYKSGGSAELRYAWDVPSLTRGIPQHSKIVGSEGIIVFESSGLYAYVRAKGRRRLVFPGLRDLMGYEAMTADFLACLEDRSRQPISGFANARRDLQIVFDAYDSLNR